MISKERAMSRFARLVMMIVATVPMLSAQTVRTRAELIMFMKQTPPASWNEEVAAQLRAMPEEQRRRGLADANHLTALWVIEAPDLTAAPRVVSEDRRFSHPMTRVGASNLYAGVAELPDKTAMRWAIEVDGRRLGAGGGLDVYARHPDEAERPGVPKGTLRQMPAWRSKVFEGTTRDWWLYVPAQMQPGMRAAVTMFQDGSSYKDYVPIVFDNLIASGEIPPMVGIFINPGVRADGTPNRSFEYDTLSPQYTSFLIDEIFPEVERIAPLRADPGSRAIVGASSGGICAFTAAWERPDQFGKVVSWVGSFTNIASGKTLREGGHNYQALVRKTPKKPIRVFLQDGANDLDNQHGNWWLSNQQMAKSLAFAGYDYKVAWGEGFHSHRHGRSIFPDTLRWLWRDYREIKSQ
jgi:enterochelin esterase-like enzyme